MIGFQQKSSAINPEFKPMKKFKGSTLSVVIVLLLTCLYFGFAGSTWAGKPLKWKTGVALYSFNRFSFQDALAKADSAGAKWVEGFFFHQLGSEFKGHSIPMLSDEEVALMKAMLDKRGLKMKSLYAGGKDEAEWKAYFVFAKKMGIEILTCEPDRKHWDLLDSLGGKYKIKIALHEHARGSSPYWHPDSVLAAIQGHPNFGACADLGHWARSGLDPVKCLQTLEGNIINIHVKDLDTFDNLKANDVVVGSGVLDYPAIIQELKRQNYTGLAYIEREANWDNNMRDVRQALSFLSRIGGK